MNEKNAGVRWLPVVRDTHVADQKVKGEAVPQALKHDVNRSGKIGFCYHVGIWEWPEAGFGG